MSRNIFSGTYINNDFTHKNTNTDKNQHQSSSSNRYIPPHKKNQRNRNNYTSKNTFTCEFKIKNDDFPSLGNPTQKEQNNNTTNLKFSNVINYKDAAEIGSKKVVAPQSKKFVTLVNKKKKKIEEDPEFESDEETLNNYIETAWFPYTSEDEEYYMNEEEYRKQETDYDY